MSLEGIKEVQRHQGLRDCYQKFLSVPWQSGQKKGKLVLQLTLKADGEVSRVTEDSKASTLHEGIFNACVFKVLSSLKFPKESQGSDKTISVPLLFP